MLESGKNVALGPGVRVCLAEVLGTKGNMKQVGSHPALCRIFFMFAKVDRAKGALGVFQNWDTFFEFSNFTVWLFGVSTLLFS